jgi:HlyD family secretion protein
MKKRAKWTLGIGLGGLTLFGILGMARTGNTQPALSVEPAQQQDLRDVVNAVGEIQARTKVNVGTSVSGEIKEIHVKDGQLVQTGDLLVSIDGEQMRQQAAQAALNLTSVQEDLAISEASSRKQEETYARYQALHAQGLVSEEDYQTQKLARSSAQSQLTRARVAVNQAKAQVALTQDSLQKTAIKASMSGRVTGLQVEKGETAIAGQTNIAGAVMMVISDMSEMLAEVRVGEMDVVKLREGAPAEVQLDALPGRTFQGKVMAVATASDRGRGNGGASGQEAQNYRVKVLLTDKSAELASLRPGMSCRVACLALEAKNVLTIPLVAVQEREDRKVQGTMLATTRTVVFVVKDGKAQERTVHTGLVSRKAVQILDGVQAGEQVVTGPSKVMASLADGTSVKVKAAGK